MYHWIASYIINLFYNRNFHKNNYDIRVNSAGEICSLHRAQIFFVVKVCWRTSTCVFVKTMSKYDSAMNDMLLSWWNSSKNLFIVFSKSSCLIVLLYNAVLSSFCYCHFREIKALFDAIPFLFCRMKNH